MEVRMTTVRQVLKEKGSEVYSVVPNATILDALKLMVEQNLGAILVMDGVKVKGIFSERDFARHSVLKGKGPESKVSEVMTTTVFYVSPENTMEECSKQMTNKHIRHLPVVEAGKVVGVISIGDIVKSIISDQQTQIQGLENYIMGTGYSQ
jgi:CBS domain-containing protein